MVGVDFVIDRTAAGSTAALALQVVHVSGSAGVMFAVLVTGPVAVDATVELTMTVTLELAAIFAVVFTGPVPDVVTHPAQVQLVNVRFGATPSVITVPTLATAEVLLTVIVH